MANLRTEIPIPAGEWTLIISNKTSARVFEKKTLGSAGYLTIAYDDAGSNPNTLSVPIDPDSDTVEDMAFVNKEWKFSNAVAGYVWAAPSGNIPGILVVS